MVDLVCNFLSSSVHVILVERGLLLPFRSLPPSYLYQKRGLLLSYEYNQLVTLALHNQQQYILSSVSPTADCSVRRSQNLFIPANASDERLSAPTVTDFLDHVLCSKMLDFLEYSL